MQTQSIIRGKRKERASEVSYNNTDSKLQSDNVQEAIDENAEAIKSLNSSTLLNTTISGTTSQSGTFYTEYAISEYDIVSAASDGSIAIPFKSPSFGKWGIALYTAQTEGLVPKTESDENVKIYYRKL